MGYNKDNYNAKTKFKNKKKDEKRLGKRIKGCIFAAANEGREKGERKAKKIFRKKRRKMFFRNKKYISLQPRKGEFMIRKLRLKK